MNEAFSGERSVRISVVTDDLQRSIDLYRDGLGLPMRALSNPILLFPLDVMNVVELEVCLREASRDLLEFDFGLQKTSGLLLSLAFSDQARMDEAAARALDKGAEMVGTDGTSTWMIEDFNGISWFLNVR